MAQAIQRNETGGPGSFTIARATCRNDTRGTGLERRGEMQKRNTQDEACQIESKKLPQKLPTSLIQYIKNFSIKKQDGLARIIVTFRVISVF